MNAYESGFADGERDAFKDRRNNIRRTLSQDPTSEYQRGYRDGYTPRNLSWLLTKPAAAWWQDRESEFA